MSALRSFGVRVSHVKIGDRTLPIYCSSDGHFSVLNIDDTDALKNPTSDADVEPLARRSVSVEAATDTARAALAKRKVKVRVPFWFKDGRRGWAYGIHAGNGDVLVEDRHGVKDRLSTSRYYHRESAGVTKGVLVADTPAERVKRLLQLRKLIKKCEDEAREIEQWYGLDLQALVLTEIETKQRESADDA